MFAALAAFDVACPWSQPIEAAAGNAQESRPRSAPTAPSAEEQRQATKDRELARRIRRSLVTDKSLSTAAHNVRIIAQNGVVTLKGSVASDQEKSAITAKAADIAGADNIKDQMTVEPKS